MKKSAFFGIFILLLSIAAIESFAATITVGDNDMSDWGINPQANDWVPDTGIICNNLSWRDSAGGPIFDEYQMCFYNNGSYYYFLKIVGMPPQGLLYDDPWKRGVSYPNFPKGTYRIVTGDLLIDFNSDNTTDCAIPAFTRVNNPGYTIYPWGSFDNYDNQSKKGEVYCNSVGSLDFYIPQNSIIIGHNIISLAKGNSTNKAGNVTVSYFLQGEIPDFMLDTLFNYSMPYPYGNWMTPISWNYRPYITRQNVTDYFDIYAIEIKADSTIFTSLYSGYTNMTLKETPTCGNDLIAGEYSSEESEPPSEIPEFETWKIIILVLFVPFILLLVSYKRGNLFKNHEHLGKLVKGVKKGDKK